MEKAFKILSIILVVGFFGLYILVSLHQEERRAQRSYKVRTLCLPNPEDTTAYKTWSENSLKAYYDHLEDSFSIVYPKKCPYCYVKHLVVNAYHKFGEDAFDKTGKLKTEYSE